MMKAQLNRELPFSGFETLKSAKKESQKRQKSLLKNGKKVCQELAKILSECSQREPCRSAACPVCARAYRLWMINQLAELKPKVPQWRSVTLIYYSDAVDNNGLLKWDPTKLHQRLRKQLSRSGIKGPVIGAVEADFHTDLRRWMLHYHLFIPWDESAFEVLRRYMTQRKNMEVREGVISRPMHVQEVKDWPDQSGYLFKSFWRRLEPYLYKGERQTKPYRPRQSEHALSLVVRHKRGFDGLLFLYGLRPSGPAWKPVLSSIPIKE